MYNGLKIKLNQLIGRDLYVSYIGAFIVISTTDELIPIVPYFETYKLLRIDGGDCLVFEITTLGIRDPLHKQMYISIDKIASIVELQ